MALCDFELILMTMLLSSFLPSMTSARKTWPLELGVCIDESMGNWIHSFLTHQKVFPHLTKLIRKPVRVGSDYRCMADALSGIMLFVVFVEYQEGKEEKNDVTEMLHGKEHTVFGVYVLYIYADSKGLP